MKFFATTFIILIVIQLVRSGDEPNIVQTMLKDNPVGKFMNPIVDGLMKVPGRRMGDVDGVQGADKMDLEAPEGVDDSYGDL